MSARGEKLVEKGTIGTSKKVGEKNEYFIYRLIQKNAPITRKNLGKLSPYSIATVSNHVKSLLDSELLVEKEKGMSSGGRKPGLLKINKNKKYIISINFEINQAVINIFNLAFGILARHVVQEFPFATSPKSLSAVVEQLRSLMQEHALKIDDIMGIGLSVPGLVERDRGELIFAPNLGWSQMEIVDYFSKRFSDIEIYLENEAKAAAIAEKEFSYPAVENLVYVSVNEGIGCGIIVGGELIRGVSGNAGEFGHMIITDDGYYCHCGNNGCWETMASENFIVKRWQERSKAKEETLPDKVYEEIRSGDDLALEIAARAGSNLGIGIANIINSLNPQLIVVGGGITRIKDYIKEHVQEKTNKNSLIHIKDETVVEFSSLGKKASNLGMAVITFDASFSSLLKS